jgi:hypothetical protein
MCMGIVGPILYQWRLIRYGQQRWRFFESGMAWLHDVCELLLVLMDLQKQLVSIQLPDSEVYSSLGLAFPDLDQGWIWGWCFVNILPMFKLSLKGCPVIFQLSPSLFAYSWKGYFRGMIWMNVPAVSSLAFDWLHRMELLTTQFTLYSMGHATSENLH